MHIFEHLIKNPMFCHCGMWWSAGGWAALFKKFFLIKVQVKFLLRGFCSESYQNELIEFEMPTL